MEYDIKTLNIPIEDKYGFLPGVKLRDKTTVTFRGVPSTFSDSRIPVTISGVAIGRDYSGLPLPEGTEEVRLVNLPDGSQVIQYEHRTRMAGGEACLQAFKLEVRSPKSRVELSDFVK